MKRAHFLVAAVAGVAVAGVVYGMLALQAPAADHPFFAAERLGVQVIAHRGGAALRPENTLEAFEHAARMGADALEMDVRATSDGAIVVLHDATVDRTTDGTGRIEQLTFEALQALDAGYRWSSDGGRSFPFRGKGVRVPKLEDVFRRLPAARMVVEMKQLGADFAAGLCALVRRAAMSQKVLVASVDHGTLGAFRDACPEVATSMSAREARFFIGVWSSYPTAALALQIPLRVRERTIAGPDLLEAARRRNLKVHVWTINNEERMRQLIGMGVDGIITDRPDRLRALRDGPRER